MNTLVETRPWGHFERFTLNEKSTVKLVYIEGDKRLSLQYHEKRSEFWKVIQGPVKVQIGKDADAKISILNAGDTIAIPPKTVHRLIGMGEQGRGIILEISTGEFDESDIVRLDDDYKRT